MVKQPSSKPNALDVKSKLLGADAAAKKPGTVQQPSRKQQASFQNEGVEKPARPAMDMPKQSSGMFSDTVMSNTSSTGTSSNAYDSNSLLAKSEISVWIDSYDDIFSDFDPRPYRERSLSFDFLEEAKRYSKEKRGKLQLRILAPYNVRNARMEAVVKKRLMDHFKHNKELVFEERRQQLKRGWSLVLLGAILMILAVIVTRYYDTSLAADILMVFLEPSGWFCFWVGFEHVLYNENKPEQEFYQKMSNIDVIFDSY